MADSPEAVQRQEVRDLRRSIAGLDADDSSGLKFEIIAPGRKKSRVYSMVDGEPRDIPVKMLDAVLGKTLSDGSDEFTAYEDKAPTYVRGQVRCAFHINSPERESGLLAEAGVASTICPAGNLAHGQAKRTHGEHKHSQETKALNAYEDDQKEEKREVRAQRTLEAQQAIAQAAIGSGDTKKRATQPS